MKKLLAILGITMFLCFPAKAIDFGSDVGKVITPTVTAGAYVAGQSMGGLQTVAVFRGFDIPKGLFNNFFLLSKVGNTSGMTVYVFDTKPTASTCTDTSAFVLNSADMPKLAFAPFVITPAVPQNGTAATGDYGVVRSVQNQDATPTQNLYICLVTNGTPTPGSTTDLVFKIAVSQD